MRVGISVTCAFCGNTKAPIGRSTPMGATYCHPTECSAYYLDPMPGSLWPGETEEDFGYPVGPNGTEERP